MPPRTSSRPSRGDWRRSDRGQKLRLAPGGRAWPARGKVRDGQVLKVRAVRKTRTGHRWIRVVTADGRLGWLMHLRTVPARKPPLKARWADVTDRGERPDRTDRKMVRPQPR